MKLTQLQSIIFFELSNSKTPLTGYDITKMVNAKGLPYSHQHIYRDANKMPLQRKLIPQDGKPDRKVMSIDPTIDYEIDASLFHIETLLAYPKPELIEQKKAYVFQQMSVVQEKIETLQKSTPSIMHLPALRVLNHKLWALKMEHDAFDNI